MPDGIPEDDSFKDEDERSKGSKGTTATGPAGRDDSEDRGTERRGTILNPITKVALDLKADPDGKEFEAHIVESFKKFDLNGDGHISREELLTVMRVIDPARWTADRVDSLWEELDSNNDDMVDLAEFAAWISKPPADKPRPSRAFKEKLAGMDDLAESIRTGKISVSAVLDEDELQETWIKEAVYHAYGGVVEGQKFGDPRPWEVKTGADSEAAKTVPAVQCQKGFKGADDPTPNQDNFSVTYFKNDYKVFCVFDGHGQDGHESSLRTVQTVPYYLCKSKDFPERMEEALKEAFNRSHAELNSYCAAEEIDLELSGTTAAVFVMKDATVWLAWCGDSRIAIGSAAKLEVIADTPDHKPEGAAEKERIEAAGGEVRSQTFGDFTQHRVFKAGQAFPGLCMTRSLGDNSGKECGVTSEPEVKRLELDLGEKPFILAASDGVWEFLTSRKVLRAVGRELKRKSPEDAVKTVMKEARRQWRENEGDCYCDDITCMLLTLPEPK